MGEVSDAQSGEQNGEVTEPSDEGNSEEKSDDISNGDPAEENPVEEEPVAEEPSEEEVADSTITVNDATINGTGDSHDVTKEEGEGTTITLTETTATEGTDYTFTAALQNATTYKDLVVSYAVKNGEEFGNSQTLEADESGNDSYTIPGDSIIGDIKITATATKMYTVTATWPKDEVDFTCETLTSGDDGSKTGKIDAGEALSFTAKINENVTTKEIAEVSYTIGGAKTPLTLKENGVYTIAAKEITGDISINVDTALIPTYKVDFGAHKNIAKVTDIKINGNASEDYKGFDETNTEITNWEIEALRDSEVSFKLEAAKQFTIGTVKADEEELKPVDGVYTIKKLTANTTITVETPLKREEVGRFSFNMAEGSDKKTATMTVALLDGATDEDGIEDTYDADGPEVLTRAEKILVSFTAVTDYKLGKVYVNGEEKQPTDETANETNPENKKYEITLGTDKDNVITVETDVDGAENAKHFALENKADHMTLGAVKADDAEITPVTEENENKGKYPVEKDTKRVRFTLTTTGAYEPIVTATTNPTVEGGQPTTDTVKAYDVETVSGKTTYTYMILASKLADTYTVTEKQIMKEVTFTGTENVDVAIDGRLIDATVKQEYVQGTKLTVKVTARENVTLNGVSYTVGEANKVNPKVTKNASEFQVTVADDTTIAIDATGALVALPLVDVNNGNKALTPVKNVYNVSYDGTYVAAIGEGTAKTPVTPSGVQLLCGNNEIAPAEGQSVVVTIEGDKAKINLANAAVADVSGKKLTLKVTVGPEDDPTNFVYTLQTTKAITADNDITVKASVSQPTDTVRRYKVSTKGEIEKLDAKLGENVTVAQIKSATIEKETGELVITTGQTPAPDGVKVIVYTGSGDNEYKKEVTVKSTALISGTTKAPGVKLKSATDISLTLTLSDKTETDLATGAVYYKVMAKAVGENPDSLEQAVTKYVCKHTVQVVAISNTDKNMVASKATIVITVVKGINQLGVDIPSTSLYKGVNKAATLKATPFYNNSSDKADQPKTKKVKWAVVKPADRTVGGYNTDQDVIFGDGKVKISNGTVTVAKDYVIKADSDENKFQIRLMVDNDKAVIGDAKAAYSKTIEITNVGLDMGKLAIVDSEGTVLAVSTESKPKTEVSLEASALNGATVEIVETGATVEKGKPLANDVEKIASTNLSYKSSKPKDVGFNGNTLTVAKANTKPVLTVTANDGSKATLGIKLNVGNDTAANELALDIECDSADSFPDVIAKDASSVTADYQGPATNIFYASLMMKGAEGGTYGYAPAYTNYDVKVTNGKKISQGVEEGVAYVEFTTDKKVVTIELTDKSKDGNPKKTYTLTNTVFAEKTRDSVNVKAKVLGKLRQSAKSAEQDVKLELQIPQEFATTQTDTNGKALAVKVDPDWSKLTSKNADDLYTFANSLDDVYTIDDYNEETGKGTVTLTFTGNVEYKQSKYVLKVSVGSKKDGKFTPATEAPAVAATVNVEKTKKFTFKPTTSYTIATRDGGVAISGKASISECYLGNFSLQNANFGGQANAFMDYFEINKVNNKLQLKENADVVHLLDNKNKNDLTGYLTYTAATDMSYYDWSTGTGTNTVKITVKINDTKPVAKYTTAQKEIQIQNRANAETDVVIQANNTSVNIKYAAFDTAANKTDACIATDDTAAKALVNENGTLHLKLAEPAAANKRTIKATVYVIPEDSFYLSEFAEAKNPDFDTYKRYGAAVTITLKPVAVSDMTLDQAEAAVKAWVDSVKAETPDWLKDEENNTSDDMKTALLDEAKKVVTANVTIDYDVKNDNTPDVNVEVADKTKAGKVSGTLKVTVGEESRTVGFKFTIPQLVPTVTKVEIKKDGAAVTTDSVQVGGTAQYTAAVTGVNLTESVNDTVTWSFADGYTGSSTIVNGLLTVDNGETVDTTLTVIATSTLDNTQKAEVVVTVTAAN